MPLSVSPAAAPPVAPVSQVDDHSRGDPVLTEPVGGIDAGAAVERVGARLAGEEIVPVPAVQDIIAATALQLIIAGEAVHGVVGTVTSVQLVVTCRAIYDRHGILLILIVDKL